MSYLDIWRKPHDIPESFIVFHGTSDIFRSSFAKNAFFHRPNMNKKIRDFGTGFYSTTNSEQAKLYAVRMARLLGGQPLLVQCTVARTRLHGLSPAKILPDYNHEWLNIIKEGRWSGRSLQFHGIYGRCGDGVTVELEKIRITNDDKALLKALTPNKGTRTYDYDQLWFGTPESLTAIEDLSYCCL